MWRDEILKLLREIKQLLNKSPLEADEKQAVNKQAVNEKLDSLIKEFSPPPRS